MSDTTQPTKIISMALPPAVQNKLRAIGQFAGHEDQPALVVSICIAFTHSLIRLVQSQEGIIVDEAQLRTALGHVELVDTPETETETREEETLQ